MCYVSVYDVETGEHFVLLRDEVDPDELLRMLRVLQVELGWKETEYDRFTVDTEGFWDVAEMVSFLKLETES